MRRLFIVQIALIVLYSTSMADPGTEYQKRLISLINAEQTFAKLSRETNTRNAFIKSFASDGMIYPRDRVNAIAHWTAQPEEKDLLDWAPLYADIAASGELGWTTGPFIFKGERTDTAASSHGYYFSVWKKEKGEWKVWVDMGLGAPFDAADTAEHFDRHLPISKSAALPKMKIAEIEASFVADQNKTGLGVFEQYLGEKCHVNRPRQKPALDRASAMKSITSRGETVQYSIVETRASASGEFAIAYGNAAISLPEGSPVRELSGHYVRIWKVYDGAWKIDVDVMIGAPKR